MRVAVNPIVQFESNNTIYISYWHSVCMHYQSELPRDILVNNLNYVLD